MHKMFIKIAKISELIAYLILSSKISSIPKLIKFYPHDNVMVCIELEDVV